MRIDSEVPFGRALYTWLYVNDLRLDKLVRHDEIEERYLAWETVRKQFNPFFREGTGFEGYLIGRCTFPEEALEAILAITQQMLEALARLYRFQYNTRLKLMKTLVREISDANSIHIWSASLGAELGKLRAQILSNPAAQAFQKRTYKLAYTLPPIVYHLVGNNVTQTYAIGLESSPAPDKLDITPQLLKPCQQDAWLVAENIGEFGHPLVRQFLDRV